MIPITMDVTLRDGGYRNGFAFSLEYALQHVKNVSDAGIDWIEIGYRNGPSGRMGHPGLTACSPSAYLHTLSSRVPAARLAVMCHPGNVTCADIDDIAANGAKMVRICLDRINWGKTLDTIGYARQQGLKTTLNITRMSHLSLGEIEEYACSASDSGVDVVYLADSLGSLGAEEINRAVSFLRRRISCAIGFHAHDNLGAALVNSIAAYTAGATFIDCSLMGMGKGAGNLKAEFWAKYLNSNIAPNRIDFRRLLDQVSVLKNRYPESCPVYALGDIVAAFCDVPLDGQKISGSDLSPPSLLMQKMSAGQQSHKIVCSVL